MLSILIPIYNFNSSELVKELNSQALELGIEFEILCYDDNSTIVYQENKELSTLKNTKYNYLEKNHGRSAIRNLLANDAQYPYLLFLDCDGKIPSVNFLSHYIRNKDEADIICGGRIYPSRKEVKPKEYLHWIYGIKRESKCNQEDARSFMTNNFLISKQAFLTTQLDTSMSGYGHEDTIFGIEMKKKGYRFKIIKNPVIHLGLYDNDCFLKNTRNSIDNLNKIIGSKYKEEEFFDIKLVKIFSLSKKLKLISLLGYLYSKTNKSLERNLKSKNPNLFLLDFYKLGYYSYINLIN